MIVCAIDIECTCGPGVFKQEIIQIGAHWVDFTKLEITHSENYLFSPKTTQITKFCTRLTGLKKEDVEGKKTFEDSFESFTGDLFYYKTNFLTSWTKFDIRKINEIFTDINPKSCWPDKKYFDSEKVLRESIGEKRTLSLSRAIELSGLEFDGRKHNGFDDAKNLALILLKNSDLFLRKLK